MTAMSLMEFTALFAQTAILFEQERVCQEKIKLLRDTLSPSALRTKQIELIQTELVAAGDKLTPLREQIRQAELDPYELLALTYPSQLTRAQVEAAFEMQMEAVLAHDRFWGSKADALRGNVKSSEDDRNLTFAYRQLEYYETLEDRLVKAKADVLKVVSR